MKRKIAIDVDDVLANFHKAIINWHNETYGSFLNLRDVKSYLFNEVWGGTLEQAIKKVELFHNSPKFKEILPIENAVSSINSLAKENDLFIVTSRPLIMQGETNRWINYFFGDKFKEIFYSSNHYSGVKNSNKTKIQICNSLNVSFLIDDSFDYVKTCSGTSIRGLLFGNYPWNTNCILPEGVSRIKDWKGALELL